MKQVLFLSVIAGFLLSACLKKETPITLPPKGDGAVMQLNMGENYDLQYFVSLRSNQVVHTSKIADWDFAFQCGSTDYAVLLNGGKGMAAVSSGQNKFAAIGLADTNGLGQQWQIDLPCGTVDSLVLRQWRNQNPVYWIRLDKTGNKLAKLQILRHDAFQFSFRFGPVNADTGTIYTLYKNPKRNFVYFSVDSLKEVTHIEPDKTSWDIQSTLYSCTFYDQNPPLPYVVNGFLLNPNNTQAYQDSVLGYNAITASVAASLPWQSRWDAIGYLWKSYDLNTNIYTAQSRFTYVVKAQNGAMFKLRFLDFYSPLGVKGSPKFEFKPL